jgi:protein kinase-like protein
MVGGGRDATQDAGGDTTQTALYGLDREAMRAMPARVGRYEICGVLGAGAMGVVYRARDPDLDRTLAIKLVRGDGAASSSGIRLMREAQAMARLHHPNVVPIFDVGPAGTAVFVAMPLLEGGTLRIWLRGGPRSLDAILDRFVAAGRGLAAAHAAGLVHRDFKPDNVLLGGGGEVQVADFGLARLAGRRGPLHSGHDPRWPDNLSQTGDMVGTPAYMSPEQLRGRWIDARADQFSFCVALWEALYGDRPFLHPRPGTGPPLRARLDAIAAGPIRLPPRPGRPAWLAEVLARGLASDPDQRWPSMQALLEAIAARRAPRRWPRWLAAGLGAACVIAAIGALGWPAPAPPVFSAVPLVHDGDLRAAAISPDGTQLAFITGDSLVIRGSEIGKDRTVVEHGVDGPLAWSPDNRHLLVGIVPELAPVIQTEVVDIEDGVQSRLPVTGFAAFLSRTEVAVTSPRQRMVEVFRLGEPAALVATCAVPGTYKLLRDLVGLPDGTMVLETEAQDSSNHGLVILGRDCELQATFEGESISGFALTDTGTLVALVPHDKLDEILEISLQGEIVSHRQVGGVFGVSGRNRLGKLLGRRHGTDYVTTLTPRTELVRVHVQDGSSQQLISIDGNASFRLAPDGGAVAWIERDDRGQDPGLLWLSTLAHMARSQALRDDALSADWSPDGQALAVLVDTSDGARPRRGRRRSTTALAILDRSGRERARMPLDHVDRVAAPIWLDDHRIAVRTDDRSTYRQLDLGAGDQGEILDSQHGATCLLSRSPHDGTLAMWRNGPPGEIDVRTEHLWLVSGQAVRRLHVEDAIRHFLAPSWSPSGELLVRAPDGMVSRVALDTGALTPITKLPAQQLGYRYDDHVMPLTGGDLLAVNHELGTSVATVRGER